MTYHRMHKPDGRKMSNYYVIPKKRRQKSVPQATREEVESAMKEYLLDGGKIERLEPGGPFGKIENMKNAQEFTKDEKVPEIF